MLLKRDNLLFVFLGKAGTLLSPIENLIGNNLTKNKEEI